ncbi:MAG: NTP transferase domain-containing protein [Gemmataceae bacterium]|nr:NTP transferase domain-containing protein [Gemmataceae bacterium]
MGRAKAWLPFGDEFLLQRVVRVVREAVNPVVVVAAVGQDVPALPPDVLLVRDEFEDRGPLAGLAAGLAALEGECEGAYLSACDAPFLTPAFVRRVVGCLEGGSFAAVPSVGGFWHPLAAAYRVEVLSTVRQMLAGNQLRMTDLLALVPTCLIGPVEFAGVDPELRSLRNLNTPDEYEAALREAYDLNHLPVV